MSNYVAFECPEVVTKHPNVRVETVEQYGHTIISKAFINGCKTCQQALSKCKCQSPIKSEALLYDRSNGKLTDAFLLFFEPRVFEAQFQTHARVVEDDVERLLPDAFDQHGGHNGGTQERFEMPEAFNPKLIAFLENRLAEFQKPPVGLYLSFPDTDIADLTAFFQAKGLVFPQDALPIRSGSHGGTTKQYAASVRITFPVPNTTVDLDMFDQFKIKVDALFISTNHLRAGLKLFVEYPHLVRLNYSGKK